MVRIALRNLRRNARRTALTLAAVAFGLAMMVFTVNLQRGEYDSMIRAAVQSQAGHVVVERPERREDEDPALLVEDADAVAATMRRRFPDGVVTPRLVLPALAMSTANSVGVQLEGIDPDAEARVRDLPDKVVEGAWLGEVDPAAAGEPLLVGAGLAESLGVGLGDKVVLMAQLGTGDMESRLFRVRGIFRTGGAEMDGFVAFAPLDAARGLVGDRDVATLVALHLPDPAEADAAVAALRGELAGRDDVVVLHWREALAGLFAIIEVDRMSGDIMMAVIGLIVAFGVLNTLLMSVLERTREFGVLLALGLRPGRLARLVVLEGLAIGLLGAALGVLLGAALSWPMVRHGLDFSRWMGGRQVVESGGYTLDLLIRGRYDPARMGLYALGAVIFCTLASLYPAWTIARLRPVEALHHR